MEANQFDRLMTVLERIADAMEGAPKRGTRTKAPEVFDVKAMRATVEAALGGKLATIDELRDVMNMRNAPAQAVSKAAQACGFARHRSASGVRFAVLGDAGRVGRPVEMPDMDAEDIENARARTGDQRFYARGFLILCKRKKGLEPRVTSAQIAELHRLYPGVFQ